MIKVPGRCGVKPQQAMLGCSKRADKRPKRHAVGCCYVQAAVLAGKQARVGCRGDLPLRGVWAACFDSAGASMKPLPKQPLLQRRSRHWLHRNRCGYGLHGWRCRCERYRAKAGHCDSFQRRLGGWGCRRRLRCGAAAAARLPLSLLALHEAELGGELGEPVPSWRRRRRRAVGLRRNRG